MISYGRQSINKKDISSVIKVLKSDWLTTGPEVIKFEKKISRIVNAKYTTVVNSATSALHIACLALGIKKNDKVWTTSNTFVSSINSALFCGAKIDLIDINLEDFNIDVKKLHKKLKLAKKNKKLPKVLIVVHFAGHPCDLKEIYKLSKIYKFKIIEDASHALGSIYLGSKIGSCKYSDITVFSFHPVKMITTGEGGSVTCNDKYIDAKVKSYRSHGIVYSNKEKNRPWMFYQKYLGFNYRLNDIQASLGISQLKKLKVFIKKRNNIARFYNQKLKNLPLQLPVVHPKRLSTFHLYVVLIKKNKKKINRDFFYKLLLKKNIKLNIHYIPIYRHPYFKKLGFNNNKFQNNEIYFKQAISLPIYPDLSKHQLNKIVFSIKNIFK